MKLLPPRYQAIPSELWERMQEHFAQETAAHDQRMRQFFADDGQAHEIADAEGAEAESPGADLDTRDEARKLIRQHLRERGVLEGWWAVAEAAIAFCEQDKPLEPVISGAGPVPARSVVELMSLEPFVEGRVDWAVDDGLTDPGGRFYPPNNDVTIPTSEQGRLLLQEWYFPSDDPAWLHQRLFPPD